MVKRMALCPCQPILVIMPEVSSLRWCLGIGVILLAFVFCPAEAVFADNAAGKHLEIVDDIVTQYPWADVRAYGAIGDGVHDDTSAIMSALNSRASIVILPPGIYKTSSELNITAGKSLRGVGAESTVIKYNGDGGFGIRLNSGEVRGLSLVADKKGQSGVYIVGIHPALKHVEIHEFDQVALRLGTAGKGGAYFADIENVMILNKDNQGVTGVLVDGLFIPNSNANSFRNVFVKGKFTTMVHLRGNNNSWYGGDTEWNTSGTGVEDVWLVDGSGNNIVGPYLEAGGKGIPPKRVFRFTAKANSNTVRDIYAQFVTDNFSVTTVDEGFGNEIDFRPKAYYLPFPGENMGLANLIPNSQFKSWTEEGPVGWIEKGGTFEKENIVLKGAEHSLKTTAKLNNPAITCYIAGHKSSITDLPIGRFQGNTVTAGVWVKTNKKGMGNLKILADGKGGGSFGRDTHSGDDTWQFLTAIAKVPNDASYLAVELRGFASGIGFGEVYFSEPILVEGIHLPLPTPATLNDSYAKMSGPLIFNHPIIFINGMEQPSVRDGNVFKTDNSEATKISGFQEGRAGQEITVIVDDSNTTIDFTKKHLRGNRGLAWHASQGDHMTCVCDGEAWYCNISVNSQELRPGH